MANLVVDDTFIRRYVDALQELKDFIYGMSYVVFMSEASLSEMMAVGLVGRGICDGTLLFRTSWTSANPIQIDNSIQLDRIVVTLKSYGVDHPKAIAVEYRVCLNETRHERGAWLHDRHG